MGKKLSDSQLAALSPRTASETLRKREQRAKQKAKGAPSAVRPRLAPVVDFPKPSAPVTGKELDTHGQSIYDAIQVQMEAAGRWNEAMAPILRTYAATSSAIAEHGVIGISPGILAAQVRTAAALGLPELPAVRRAAQAAEVRRFGLDRQW